MKTPIEVFSDWAISGKDEGMKENHFKPVMKMIELFENKYKNPSIIDAGCGNGWLIRHFDENNCRILVLDRFQKPRFRYDSESCNLRIGSIPGPT